MSNIIKISELSSKYKISARTLRYYEDMGLINSIRSENYAYRTYDESALKRLEQILILRKLNISIKDIQRIFNNADSSVILDVLEGKIHDIDEEVAILHELKEIVLAFIRHIDEIDFSKDNDVKQLYEKAKEIEKHIVNVNYDGNSSKIDISRLLEITEKLDKKIPDVMIIKIPKFRAVTSGLVSWDEVFGSFGVWRDTNEHLFKDVVFDCADFLMGKDGKAEWVWGVKDDVTEADVNPYNLIEFTGGLYAVAVSVDGDGESHDKVRQKLNKWLETTNFIEDSSRLSMGNMIYPHEDIMKGLGYHQMNLYLPIKLAIE
jgi:DNA-binding transcriptional MerR regulator